MFTAKKGKKMEKEKIILSSSSQINELLKELEYEYNKINNILKQDLKKEKEIKKKFQY